MTTARIRPLSRILPEEQLDALAELLATRGGPGALSDLEQLDGFCCAHFIGPVRLDDEAWPAVVLDREDLDDAARDEAATALHAFREAVEARVTEPPERALARALPLVLRPEPARAEEEFARGYGSGWAKGFFAAAALDAKAWEDEVEAVEELAEVWEIAHSLLKGSNRRSQLEMLYVADVDALLADLSWRLHEVHLVNEEERARTPVRRAGPKVGRNDPCPCGSGRKYKHCCGRR